MIQVVGMVLLISGLGMGLWLMYDDAAERRKRRARHRRYLKKFREGQRECDELFTEQEHETQQRQKWDKQNIICKNPDLITFWR